VSTFFEGATSVPGSLAPALGARIGETYRVERVLGEGAMGIVLLATDEHLQRRVALKLIRPELLGSPDTRARFLSEARAMARVSHRNVLQIHAFGEHGDAPYFVMEYVEGRTVEDWLSELRADAASGAPDAPVAPPLEQALAILEETCRGVAAIHAAETIHRDLKPSNLLLDASMHVRVADLGLAAVLHRAGARSEIVGTPEYIAPEVALQHELPAELAQRADVYSIGCIAYELLTGAPPFAAPTTLALMLKHASEAVVPPSRKRPEIGAALDGVVLRALAKDPAERTPSVDALRRELVAARNGTSEPVRILVAEDDADFREALAIALRREFPDAELDLVGDGNAALRTFDERQHSVAIVDLQMPHLDGIALTALLRARESAAATAILVVTASGGPTEWKRLSAMGADGFLVKPVNLKDVVTLVRRALGERSRSYPPGSIPPPQPSGTTPSVPPSTGVLSPVEGPSVPTAGTSPDSTPSSA
jgi:serine/threonine-protein kinase